MKLPRIFIVATISCLLVSVYNCRPEKEKTSTAPPAETEDIEELRPSPREVDSINSLKKKKSKRFDSLKPGVAALEESE